MAERNEGRECTSADESVPSVQESVSDQASSSSVNPAGSIFASPKLNLSGTNNPFAVRNSPNRLNENSENDATPSILAPSKLAAAVSSTAASSSSNSSKEVPENNGTSGKLVMRPSVLTGGSAIQSSNHNSILKPATLRNPFNKPIENNDLDESPSCAESNHCRASDIQPKLVGSGLLTPGRLNHVSTSHVTSAATVSEAPAAAGEEGSVVTNASPSSVTFTMTSSSNSTPPSFTAPQFSSTKPEPTTTATSVSNANLFTSFPLPKTSQEVRSSAINFVFGEKLHERVANPSHPTQITPAVASSTESTVNGVSSASNLFDIIAKKADEDPTSPNSSNGLSKTLTDSARELEEARAAKRKYEEVTVITGEEDEQNALQINGKLFTYDKAQGTWVERGRGTLRLNDRQVENQPLQSRLVMRTQGSLRVILNTKVWADMTVDKAGSKSIRMTAFDGDQIRVFLLMASPKDTDTLFNAMEWRLATLRAQQSRANSSSDSSSVKGVEEPITSPKRRSISEPDDSDEAKKKRCD